ncbi:MAG: hypothetical protein ACR2F8_01435 [Caulobacteraceae bacterium]
MSLSARPIRTAGVVACLVGLLTMVSGRFVAGAPTWLTYVGVVVIFLGWGLFGWYIVTSLRSRSR